MARGRLKFAFSDNKALDALAFIAGRWDAITPFYISKVLFLAEKEHLNAYGRPIIGDTYIAMPKGPVPSTVKNIVDENFEYAPEPDNFRRMLRIDRGGLRKVHSLVDEAALVHLSETDRECLANAIEFCRGKSVDELSNFTHFDKAWRNAPANRPMRYEDFFDEKNPDSKSMLADAQEFAVYGVL